MTRNFLPSATLLTVLTLGLGGQAIAQGGTSGRGVGPMALQKAEQAKKQQAAGAEGRNSLSAGDRRLVQVAAASGLFEVEAARMASSKAADAALQRYAATLVEDHTQANEDLRRMANAKGLSLPNRPAAAQQRALERLSQLKAEAFDREFLRVVGLREHQQDIQRFRAASRHAQDPELRRWADQMLPTLERHLSQARDLPMMSRMSVGADAATH